MTRDPHTLVAELQTALGLRVVSGTISLNMNESKLQSVKTETYQRVTAAPMPIDKPTEPRAR